FRTLSPASTAAISLSISSRLNTGFPATASMGSSLPSLIQFFPVAEVIERILQTSEKDSTSCFISEGNFFCSKSEASLSSDKPCDPPFGLAACSFPPDPQLRNQHSGEYQTASCDLHRRRHFPHTIGIGYDHGKHQCENGLGREYQRSMCGSGVFLSNGLPAVGQ